MTQRDHRGIQKIEREKGIESGTLIEALEDALLAAYKKTSVGTRHAWSSSTTTPATSACSPSTCRRTSRSALSKRLGAAIQALEQQEEETGERSHVLVTDEDLTIDLTDVPENVIEREDVTPDDFGRIAAQTAKQVILQRIREAEREMMYDEYIDRVSESSPASSSRQAIATTSSSTSARWRRYCRARSRSTASATSRAAASRRSLPR